jgi:hypothetical protein
MLKSPNPQHFTPHTLDIVGKLSMSKVAWTWFENVWSYDAKATCLVSLESFQ